PRPDRAQSQDRRQGRGAAQEDPVLQAQQGVEGSRQLRRAYSTGFGFRAGCAAKLEARGGPWPFAVRGQYSLWITSGRLGATDTLPKSKTLRVASSAMPKRRTKTRSGLSSSAP